ncbi:NAD kinase [Prevotella sp. P4-67]|uniref:NAD kinase n=1 Tax=Prevotella sp. P4-67 TaxID=2024227 RepID=UPI000B97805A|nr:NAD kinase [Prevotella sp. P4-67]OYP75650.1 NAD kinase [Prevotella sp. P4-67]
MAANVLRFALFGKEFQAGKTVSIHWLIDSLKARGAEIYIERTFFRYITSALGMEVEVSGVFDNYNFDVDFVISIGGDGTFLRAASMVGSKATPIIGVNTGRLGFLADIHPDEIDHAIAEIADGHYAVEPHAVIMVEADGEIIEGSPFALNDIAVLKRDNAAMISVRTCINGEYLVTYQADGLIVSTPTGSTAYGLSNGGPIIVPDADILCLTPVAPHSLNVRPIVINDDSEITLEVESRSHNFLVAIDGRSEKLLESTRLTIRKAPYTINIVKRDSRSYFSTLREKMMWGADHR